MTKNDEANLYNAARSGDFKLVTDLLNRGVYSSREIEIAFALACMNGQYFVVNSMLSNPCEDLRPNVATPLTKGFTNALDGFFKACQNDYLNIVDLILNNPDKKNRPDLDSTVIAGLRCAASAGNLDIIKYMLGLPEIKKHLDIVHNDISVFYTALINSQEEVLKYFIFDLYLEKTNEVVNLLNDVWDKNIFNLVNKCFATRDLSFNLNKELNFKDKYKLKSNRFNKV